MNPRRLMLLTAMAVFVLFAQAAWSAAELTFNVYPEKFVEIGKTFYYNIQITNTGNAIATSVSITTDCDSNITGCPATISLSDIPAGKTLVKNVQVTVKPSTPNKTVLTSSFELSYSGKKGKATISAEVKNRAYTKVERALDDSVTTGYMEHYDFSADGKKVVYEYMSGWNNADIYIINVDGTGKEQLTNDPACESEPDISPDGTKVVFKTNVNKGTVPHPTYDPSDNYNSDLYVIDLETKAITQLTSDGDCQIKPRYSPDGTKILFIDDHYTKDGEGDRNPLLWVMDADGDNQTQLTEDPYTGHAVWTPDSNWIIYNYNEDGSNYSDLYKIKPDGSDKTQLTFTDEACEQWPEVSPDGKTILFKYYYQKTKNGDWYHSIAIMDIDGYNMRVLLDGTPSTLPNGYYMDVHRGKWSPNGRWIVFGWDTFVDDVANGWVYNTWVMDKRAVYKGLLSAGYYERKWNFSPDGKYIILTDWNSIGNRTPNAQDFWLLELNTTDEDNDKLALWEEDIVGTDPNEFDTDGDSAGDGREFDQGSNPLLDDCPRPPELSAEAGDKKVKLTWTAPEKSGDIEYYRVYMSTSSGGPYELVADEVEETSYTVEDLENGTTYYFVVTSVDEDKFESGDSNEVSATPEAPGEDDDTGDDDEGGGGGCGCGF